jgi:RNA polymerase sigma-70 factor, ECF subfamily
MMRDDPLVNDLFAAYEAPLRRYALGLARDFDQADDLVQEAFVRAAANHELLDGLEDSQRRAWLYTVVKNRFLDQVRAGRRRQAFLEKLADMAGSDEGSMAFAGEINLFERMPARFRALLQQRYVQGMTSEEIAAGLHLPAATVRSRIRLAISWLRAHQDEWM